MRDEKYDALIESLTGSVYGSPYVHFELNEKTIVLDGDFTIEDLQKIIEYKKGMKND